MGDSPSMQGHFIFRGGLKILVSPKSLINFGDNQSVLGDSPKKVHQCKLINRDGPLEPFSETDLLRGPSLLIG